MIENFHSRKIIEQASRDPANAIRVQRRRYLDGFYHLSPSWTTCIKAADFLSCSVSDSVKICLTTCETPLDVKTHGNDK